LKTNGNKREAKTLTYKKKTGPRIKYYSSLACETIQESLLQTMMRFV
jgi:hypothetical protein